MGEPENVAIALQRRVVELEQELANRDEELLKLRDDHREDVHRLRTVVANAPVTLWVVDRERRIVFAEGAGLRTIGMSPESVVGMNVFDLFPSLEKFESHLEQLRHGQPVTAVSRVGDRVFESRIGGIWSPDGEMLSVIGVSTDITERVAAQNALESELRRIERLETFAVVASGFGHDFNNLLTAILGYVGLVGLQVGNDAAARTVLDSAERAALQAKELTARLLAFAKGGSPKRQLLDLGTVLEDAVAVALRGSSAKAALTVEPDLWAVEGDATQLSQIAHNLLLNASQSMPGGGQVEVSAANVDIAAGSGVPLPTGRYVRLRVQDRGCGIPAEQLEQVFDPYFTTKPTGTGLGLTTTHSAVRGHGGHIRVSSTVGLGTRVDVFLPATERRPEPPQAPPSVPSVRPGARVLVMDDDASVAQMAQHLLVALACDVELAADGAECVALYRKQLLAGRPFDAVLLDLTVPGGMGAKEAIRKLRELDPAVKAIVTTGYSNDPLVTDHASLGFAGALSKPYRLRDLAVALGRVLAGGGH